MKHLKTFEYYDSEIEKEFNNLTKGEIKNMAYPDDIKDMFRYGLYAGKNSVDLNDTINDVMRTSSSSKEMLAIIDESYKILVGRIPILRTFEINKEHFEDNSTYLNLNKVVDVKLNSDYIAQCNIYVVYHKKGEDLLNYENDKLKFSFFVSIRPKNKSIPLDSELLSSLTSGNESDFDNALQKLSKKLYDSPDKEDLYFTRNLNILENNIELNDLYKITNLVKENLMKFNMYISDKYKISLY